MSAALPLERFAPIGLDELVVEAGLLTRVDRKYVMSVDAARSLLGALDPQTRALDLDGVRSSAYESVYFDTPDLLSFHLAAQSRRRRFKVRTRTYVESHTAFLEVKTRGARRATVKDRIEYEPQRRSMLTVDALDFAADALDAVGVEPRRATELRPRLTTRYRRATLLSSDGARCTVDTELAWHDVDGRVLTAPHLVIVESKSAAGASVIDRTLWRAGIRPARISKYGTGLAALHPELPRAKWSRLLRGPLTDATVTPHPTPHPLEASCSPAA